LVGVLAFFAMVIFSTLFYIVERSANDKVESLPMSLYWATITSVTVGYGMWNCGHPRAFPHHGPTRACSMPPLQATYRPSRL
jgi:hypothetical protein